MLADAFVLAAISTIGYELAFSKLPPRMQRFLIEHALLTDFLTFIITYLTLGGTLTALTAGAMVSLFTSFLMHVAHNQEQFQYIIYARDWIHEKASELGKQANEWAAHMKAEHRARQLKTVSVVSVN